MYREWQSAQPLVRCTWGVSADADGVWLDPATEFWALGFGATAAGPVAQLIGPAAAPRSFVVAAGDRFWGLDLHAHVFLRGLPKPVPPSSVSDLRIVDAQVQVAGVGFAYPGPGDLDATVDRLAAAGVLVAEPAVGRALRRHASGDIPASQRSLRRQVRAVTGLNRQQIAGVQRAREAFALLSAGVPIGDVVHRVGYTDQAHLTRSLRALAGRTPGQILSGADRPDSG